MWQHKFLGFFPLSTNPWYFCKDTELGEISGKTEIATAAGQHPDASSGTKGASFRRWVCLPSSMECVLSTARVRQSETSRMTWGTLQETSSHWAEVAARENPWDGWKWAMRKGPQGKRESYLIIVISVCLTLSLGVLLLEKAVNYHGPDVNKTWLFSIQEFSVSQKHSLIEILTKHLWLTDYWPQFAILINLWGKKSTLRYSPIWLLLKNGCTSGLVNIQRYEACIPPTT